LGDQTKPARRPGATGPRDIAPTHTLYLVLGDVDVLLTQIRSGGVGPH